MAAPVVQAVGTEQASASAAISPAWPTHASGDWGVLIVATSNEAVTLTDAQGFVELADGTSPQSIGTTGSASSLRLAIYLCVATSSSMTAPTIADSGAVTMATIFTIRGAAGGTPYDVKAGSTQSTGTSFSNPGITTTVNDCLVVFITGNTSDTTTPQTTWDAHGGLTSWAANYDANTSAGNGVGYSVASGVKATAGAVAAATGTLATSSAKCHYAIAFKPAATEVTGSVSTTLGAATSSAAGTSEVAGAVARMLGTATVAGAGSGDAGGSLARTLGAATVSAAGGGEVSGSVTRTLGAAISSTSAEGELGAANSGTTSAALREQQMMVLGFSFVIEGFEYILTDASPVAPVIEAYAGSGFELALPGLRLRGAPEQEMEPWADSFDVPHITVMVQPDPDDIFGKAVFRTKASFSTRLTDVYQAETDGSGTMTVHSTADAAPSGTLYAGRKRFIYTARPDGHTFTIATAGSQAFNPFTANVGSHYSQPHEVPTGEDFAAAANPRVSDTPPTWIGRKVALRLHRIQDGVWDTYDQAHLEFAGTIVGVGEDANGFTILDCDDIRAEIRDATLLKDQWTAYVSPGCRLIAGTKFLVTGDIGSIPLVVVASGAVAPGQVDEGVYELSDLVSIINKSFTLVGSELGSDGDYAARLVPQESGGSRFVVSVTYDTTSDQSLSFGCTDIGVMEFLGFGGSLTKQSGYWQVQAPTGIDVDYIEIVSPGPPYLIKPFQWAKGQLSSNEYKIDLEQVEGEWINHSDFLPAPFDTWPAEGEQWSFIKIGSQLAFARWGSPEQLDRAQAVSGIASYANDRNALLGAGLTVDDDGDRFAITQVVILSDSFAELIPRLFASTDGRGVNHATYDAFPTTLACPGIPWSLLGTDFIDSCRSLEQALAAEAMMIVLEKPTKLTDILMPELAARFAWLVFKNGRFRFVSPPTPNPLETEWTIDDDVIAGPKGDPLAPVTEITSEYLRNIIKLEFNRTVGGVYQDTLTVKDPTSIADYGITRERTISLPGTYVEAAGTGAAAEALAMALVARCLPVFAKPMKKVRVPIAPTLFQMTPGDTVSLSSNWMRDPVSGERGINGRACICLSTKHDYGHEDGTLFGEVELLLTDEDRISPLSPCAQVDHTYTSGAFTAGYDGAGFQLQCLASEHSRSSDPVDVSNFAAGDLVLIQEVDPADPDAPLEWERELASVDALTNRAALTTALASPAFDTTKRYRMVPQRYSQVLDSQLATAFLADDDDALIEDLAEPNLYAEDTNVVFTRQTPERLRRLLASSQGDEGRPLHSGLIGDLIDTVNNLFSYSGAPHCPFLVGGAALLDVVSTDWVLMARLRFFIGATPYKHTRRKLTVAPLLWVSLGSGGETAYCRVTLSQLPPVGPSITDYAFRGAKQQVTFSTTATLPEQQAELPLGIVTGPEAAAAYTWLSIEMKATGGAQANVRGLTHLYAGPVTS